jgi:hypothetical protein
MGPLMAKMVRRSKSDIVSQLRKSSCQTRNLKRLALRGREKISLPPQTSLLRRPHHALLRGRAR